MIGQYMRRRGFRLMSPWALGVLALIAVQPVATTPLRLFRMGLLLAVLVGGGWLAYRVCRRHRALALALPWALITLFAFGLLHFTRGAGTVDQGALRAAYLARLCTYTGTLYVWGGESRLGIDCSGLARTAFWEAMVTEGVRRGDLPMLGQAWGFWWHDVTARDLRDGAYGYTRIIGEAAQLATYDHAALQPGDMAVSLHGAHVLIYLGDRRWIEADPAILRVAAFRAAPRADISWFHLPVTLVRWRWLEVIPWERAPSTRERRPASIAGRLSPQGVSACYAVTASSSGSRMMRSSR